MKTEYKPYILLIMFALSIMALEFSIYGDEIIDYTEQQTSFGLSQPPVAPFNHIWHVCIPLTSLCIDIPNLAAWLCFFGNTVGYLFTILGVALLLPVDSIPLVVKIFILAPIWIMTIVLAYNATKSLVKTIGEIIPL